jgi:hypothetical protein
MSSIWTGQYLEAATTTNVSAHASCAVESCKSTFLWTRNKAQTYQERLNMYSF